MGSQVLLKAREVNEGLQNREEPWLQRKAQTGADASGGGTCLKGTQHGGSWESEPILFLLTPSHHPLAERSRKQRAGNSSTAS